MSNQATVTSRQVETTAESAAKERKNRAAQDDTAQVVMGSMMFLAILAGVYVLARVIMYYAG